MSDVVWLDGVAALGPEWDPVFRQGAGVQSTRGWFDATIAAAVPGGARPVILAVRDEGRPVAVLPMLDLGGGRAQSLTSPYTVLFQPMAAAGDAEMSGLALGRAMRRWAVVTLEGLDPGWAGFGPFQTGLRRAGLLVAPFDHFRNWFQDGITGWEAYLAGRPGALRETLRRRGRAASRDGTVRFEVVDSPDGLEAAMAAYEDVYGRSWKVPEPYGGFNAALLPLMAQAGALRLGVMWRGDTPLAAQYWTVADGVATILKLAHVEGEKQLSPGTLLTGHMIRHVLEEGATGLDFGRGDDDYKRLWVGSSRQRVGLLLGNRLRLAGLVAVGRQRAGQVVRWLRAGRGAAGAGGVG